MRHTVSELRRTNLIRERPPDSLMNIRNETGQSLGTLFETVRMSIDYCEAITATDRVYSCLEALGIDIKGVRRSRRRFAYECLD